MVGENKINVLGWYFGFKEKATSHFKANSLTDYQYIKIIPKAFKANCLYAFFVRTWQLVIKLSVKTNWFIFPESGPSGVGIYQIQETNLSKVCMYQS